MEIRLDFRLRHWLYLLDSEWSSWSIVLECPNDLAFQFGLAQTCLHGLFFRLKHVLALDSLIGVLLIVQIDYPRSCWLLAKTLAIRLEILSCIQILSPGAVSAAVPFYDVLQVKTLVGALQRLKLGIPGCLAF